MWTNYTKLVVLYNDRGKIVNIYVNEECDDPIVNNSWYMHKTYIINTNDDIYLRMVEIPRYIQGIDYLINDMYEVLDVY